ncbi:DUF982 domain-containing protein [Aureimonas glaciei]|jgi:hypothetical protein|uniref:DUF982 domain-containing protein n=1 Tax=Aureimonas glaciei TaxID=1776957 RepID=A0A916XYX9_9HYPH|nr:DUF982 domain-containing protein [Aureimonas glaciei]GGD22402.1 hypothetical protein GCM10011335_26620 [Aureimonas glaciei]
MENNVFDQPVWVYSGLNIPFALQNAAQAHSFLLDSPGQLRGIGYSGAVNACLAALRGEVDAQTARAALVAYARRNGILMPDADDLVAAAAMARRTTGASA